MAVPSKPLTALTRLQDLIGRARSLAQNDQNPNRLAQLCSVLDEAFDVALASRCGEPLPKPVDHSRIA